MRTDEPQAVAARVLLLLACGTGWHGMARHDGDGDGWLLQLDLRRARFAGMGSACEVMGFRVCRDGVGV